MRAYVKPIAAALVITAVALAVYGGVLFNQDPPTGRGYPWSSDAWGHLIKAEYLREQIGQGHWYPDLFPHWYSGQQMLRYYAPLPYYALVGLLLVTGDVFAAGNWLLFGAALGGGLSMLLFARRFGLAFATIGGVLLVLLPDNLRVAFAEGNLPRVLAASLLPATFYLFLNLLSEERHRRLCLVGVAALLCLAILSHAMMGAIFSVCLMLFAIVYWLTAGAKARHVFQAILTVFTGVLLAGWWLLPSLTGGITDLNVEAASEALAYFPWSVSLDPSLRWSNKEAYYIGASFILALCVLPFYWRRLNGATRSLFIVAVITAAISSTLLNELYNSVPLHQLFWPVRFMSFAGFILVLSTVALLSKMWRLSGPKGQSIGRFVTIGVALAMAVDFWQSAPLAHTRDVPSDVAQVAERLRDSPGWRVATADLSQLGSPPAYLFSAVGGKEQVFGWAYQGAATAPLLSTINQAIETGRAAFAVDRLERLGADDIVVLKNLPEAIYKVSPEFREALPQAGYALTYQGGRVDLYHRDGGPRVYRVDAKVFAIGSGAQNLALLFPEIVAGTDPALDIYSVEFLSQFDTLVLAGFNWKDKARAEQLVRELASSGHRVIIDLTGAPLDVLARVPKFLDVYGEHTLVPDRVRVDVGGVSERLMPFDGGYSPWQAVVPQGLDSREITADFGPIQGAVVGSRRVGTGRVTFLGLNLMFHAVLTGDPLAIGILEREIGVQASRRPQMEAILMRGYAATQAGYRFSLELREPGYYLIPVAYHSGTAVYVDGEETPSLAVDTLTLAQLPAGTRQVEVRSLRTPVYKMGCAATALGLLVIAAILLAGVRIPFKRFTFLRGASSPLG